MFQLHLFHGIKIVYLHLYSFQLYQQLQLVRDIESLDNTTQSVDTREGN